jgi:hypothetical protein
LSDTTTEPDLLRLIVGDLLVRHPLPWRVVQDWTWEVRDANDAVVVKMPRSGPATDFVAYAERVRAERDEFAARFLSTLTDEDEREHEHERERRRLGVCDCGSTICEHLDGEERTG